jgi:hypothetical protein
LTSTTEGAYSVEDTVAMMVHTNEHEKYVSEGVSYWDCFTGVDLRRTEIISCVWMIQVFCGIWYGGNVVYFLEQAGFNPTKSFDFGVGENCHGKYSPCQGVCDPLPCFYIGASCPSIYSSPERQKQRFRFVTRTLSGFVELWFLGKSTFRGPIPGPGWWSSDRFSWDTL